MFLQRLSIQAGKNARRCHKIASRLHLRDCSTIMDKTSEGVAPVKKVLDMDSMNPCVKNVEYAVRGPIVQLASQLQEDLYRGVSKPYTEIIKANIGDCHATGQKPITFFRQVLAACSYPQLLAIPGILPTDVDRKVRQILSSCRNSIGCYSDSEGTRIVREKVADYIAARDGYKAFDKDIFLTNGASSAVKIIMTMLISTKMGKKTGVMVPVPQYPLYSATISELDGELVPYYLNEEKNWSLDIKELQKSYDKAKETCAPKAIVVINPGNPTGQVLSNENIIEIVKFAERNGLMLLADEVYQENIHDMRASFHSFKKVINDMGGKYSQMELVSFHSVSKGYYGECGIRGGYMECVNLDPEVKAQLVKLLSAQLGSSVPGQVILNCIVDPPKPGDESYKTYVAEKEHILSELREKASIVHNRLNSMKRISCNQLQGAMYAFPRLRLSKSAIEEAGKKGMEPDAFYCSEFLKSKGICVVPGSGFKQVEGTYHFRTTILPSIREIYKLLKSLEEFNTEFHNTYP